MRDVIAQSAAELRYAVRSILRIPTFALTAVFTLGAGIGATTAIFSAVYAVALRPLPFRDPDRLVRVYVTSPVTTQHDEASPRTFAAWRRESRSFEHISAMGVRNFTFDGGAGLPQQVTGARTTGEFFPMLGVAPALGRTFGREEDRRGRSRVVLLSHQFWATRLGGDRTVIGRTVRLDATPFVVIGVMPASLDLGSPRIDLWTPLALTVEAETDGETGFLDVVARLRRGVGVGQAQAELADLTRRLDEGHEGVRRSARVIPYEDDLIGSYRGRLFTLLGAVGFVLLIACVNVANLLLARGRVRAKEFAVRSALGAGRRRIIGQLLTESLVLCALGGVAGLFVAYAALAMVRAFAPEGVPRLAEASMDVPSFAFTVAASAASALAFAVVLSLRAGDGDPQSALKESGRSTAAGRRDRLRQTLVVLEVAFALVLLVGAGLLIRTAMILQRVEPGLDPERLWTGAVTFTALGYPSAERITQAAEQMAAGVRRLPGVRSAAVVSVAPFTGLRALGMFVPEGRPVEATSMLLASFRLASPHLFRTLGVSLRDGRDFSDRDAASTPPVVIVNESFARLAWPGHRAVGRRLLGPGGNGPDGRVYREVIAVVGDTREDGLREPPRPAVYYPIRQASYPLWESTEASAFLVVRTAVNPLSITRQVQQVVAAVHRGIPLFDVRSMEQRMTELVATARFNTLLLVTLGTVGLALAAVGVYGVIGYLVGERRQEIGVRMALGATPTRVIGLVVWEGVRPALIGIGFGTAAALGLTRTLASQLYGIPPTDPVTFIGVAGALVIVASVAAAIPAASASRVPPREALGT